MTIRVPKKYGGVPAPAENVEVIKEPRKSEEPEDDNSEQESVATNATQAPEKKNCCYRFWNAIFKFFAQDSIYGSFVGPHPVSFFGICFFCRICKGTCMRPFALASVATKTMWFIMLVAIIILSAFFLVQGPAEIASYFPCADKELYFNVKNNITQDCVAHGGHFMIYRCFFSFNVLLLGSCFTMINVKSTKKNRKRAKMHHGFWMYKYLILLALLCISFLAIRVESGGAFEYFVSWVGLLAALVFSFVEITLILDLLEMFCQKNRTSESDWADCIYWTFTGIMVIVDIAVFVGMCMIYARNQFRTSDPKEKEGDMSINELHMVVLCYAAAVCIVVLASSIFNCIRKRKIFLYAGVLQSTFVILYTLCLVWSGLQSSPNVKARPHLKFNITPTTTQNAKYKYTHSLGYSRGNWDITFEGGGFVHAIISLLTLVNYVFWNAPRTQTAPLSIFFDKLMYWNAKKPETPVIPIDGAPKDEFDEALKNAKVWDDEKHKVRYSWTLFYVFMMLGSFSVMMGMCNFSDPWAVEWFSSSVPALFIKLLMSLLVSLAYVLLTTIPCKQIFPQVPASDEEPAEADPEAPPAVGGEDAAPTDLEKGPPEQTPLEKIPPPPAKTSLGKTPPKAPVPLAKTENAKRGSLVEKAENAKGSLVESPIEVVKPEGEEEEEEE